MSNFKITRSKGFHITFANGYTVSVQFGPGNYCDHYNADIGREEELCGRKGSALAETAVWGPDGKMIDRGTGDTVQGYQSADDVLALMTWAASQK